MSDFSKLKTIAQAYSDLIDSEDQDSLAEARDEYELTARVDVVLELIAEFEIIKSNNADMILRNKVLRERPDLKPDRIACHSNVVSIQSDLLRLKQENESMKKDAARYRWLRDESIDPGAVIDKKVGTFNSEDGGYPIWEYRAGKELDDAIDTAMIEVNNK